MPGQNPWQAHLKKTSKKNGNLKGPKLFKLASQSYVGGGKKSKKNNKDMEYDEYDDDKKVKSNKKNINTTGYQWQCILCGKQFISNESLCHHYESTGHNENYDNQYTEGEGAGGNYSKPKPRLVNRLLRNTIKTCVPETVLYDEIPYEIPDDEPYETDNYHNYNRDMVSRSLNEYKSEYHHEYEQCDDEYCPEYDLEDGMNYDHDYDNDEYNDEYNDDEDESGIEYGNYAHNLSCPVHPVNWPRVTEPKRNKPTKSANNKKNKG